MNLIRLSWYATAAFGFTATAALGAPFMRGVAAVVAVAMFAGGTFAMGAALVIAAGRSRTEAIGIGGLFFLQDSAPDVVRRQLLGSLVVQVAVGLATAAARPYTASALGVLAPVAGLGLAGLWAARLGTFGPRTR